MPPAPARISPDLLEACRRGDPDAFEALVAACRDRVYSLACHLSGSETAAGDITQDVFVKLLTRLAQFRHQAEFTTWLYRIVANVAIDYRRASRRLVSVEEAAPVWSQPALQEQRYLRAETATHVREALARLPPRFRVPLALRYLEGLSYEEIAGVLRLSTGTVASRLARGLRQLGAELSDLRLDVE
ncbi:MAG TPA: sigma-70 family RNA polymerase sigma factor [Vicinamibacterales bacterium]|nr:sigma-70 family RNA polymerase sigma factor [Vicinamibacterales bacterium]